MKGKLNFILREIAEKNSQKYYKDITYEPFHFDTNLIMNSNKYKNYKPFSLINLYDVYSRTKVNHFKYNKKLRKLLHFFDVYVTAYNYSNITLNNKKYKYGAESYLIFKNKYL